MSALPLGLVVVVLLIGGIYLFSGCGKKAPAAIRSIEHGPFTIQSKLERSRYFNMNYGRMSTHERTDYQVLYRGKPLVFPPALQTNTGYSNLWKAYILEGAPQPALIAGSQSMYLITEEDGQARLRILDEQDSGFAGLQWLDSHAGQPARNQEVYMSADQDSSLILSGGDYLLISCRTVLQVPDLRIHALNNQNWIDGYSILSTNGAVAFSPDRQQVVFVGSKNDESDYLKYHYGMMVFNYVTGDRYVLPFDQTDTRMRNIHLINEDWMQTFFEWRPEAVGGYRFSLRPLEKLPYWQGWMADEDTYYHLQPVADTLLPVFADFVLQQWRLSPEVLQQENVGDFQYIHIQYGALKFTVGYRAVEKDLHFSKHIFAPESEEYQALVVQIGKAFDEALAQGKYEGFFTRY